MKVESITSDYGKNILSTKYKNALKSYKLDVSKISQKNRRLYQKGSGEGKKTKKKKVSPKSKISKNTIKTTSIKNSNTLSNDYVEGETIILKSKQKELENKDFDAVFRDPKYGREKAAKGYKILKIGFEGFCYLFKNENRKSKNYIVKREAQTYPFLYAERYKAEYLYDKIKKILEDLTIIKSRQKHKDLKYYEENKRFYKIHKSYKTLYFIENLEDIHTGESPNEGRWLVNLFPFMEKFDKLDKAEEYFKIISKIKEDDEIPCVCSLIDSSIRFNLIEEKIYGKYKAKFPTEYS